MIRNLSDTGHDAGSTGFNAQLQAGGGKLQQLSGEMRVGRSANCDIIIDDPGVSRRHAKIVVVAMRVLVEDLGSVNGTWVNDQRVEGVVELADGDTLMFDKHSFKLMIEGASADLDVTVMASKATIVGAGEPVAYESPCARALLAKPGRGRGPVAAKRGRCVGRGCRVISCLAVVLLVFVAYRYTSRPEQALLQSEPRSMSVTPLFRAEEAWRTGELVDAITIVKRLSSGPGGQLAAARLSHYSRVLQDYEKLSAMASGPEYARQMTSFYLALNPVDDQFFWQYLEQDFERIATPELADVAWQFLRNLQKRYPDMVLSSYMDKLESTTQGNTSCAKLLPGILC